MQMFRRTDDLAGLLVVELLVPVEQAQHGEGGGEDQADPQGHVPREAREVNPLRDTWRSLTFTVEVNVITHVYLHGT